MKFTVLRPRLSSLAALLPLLLLVSLNLHAADILLVNNDGANEGFNDPSAPFANQTGNNGATLGQQRLRVFQAAADYWEARLVVDVDVRVGINFDPLSCASFSATLGSAGASNLFRNFTNAPRADTWYVSAAANNLAGRRLGSNTVDIQARFNSEIDNNDNCLRGTNWWLGIGSPAPNGTISLFDTVLHEIGHGLGVSSGIRQNGQMINGIIDAYAFYLYDETQGQFWRDMTVQQRVTSATNTGNVTFRSPSVNANTSHITTGKNNGRLRVYAPSPYRGGSSISHWDTALVPDELMEPSATPTSDDRATFQMLKDVGWRLVQDQNPPTEEPGTVSFSSSAVSADEDQGSVDLVLRRTGGSDGAISVTVNTQNGSASSGSDYQSINNQVVTWADGDDSNRSVRVNLVNDNTAENNEDFTVSINNATGGANIGVGTAMVTIEDDDAQPGQVSFSNSTVRVGEEQGSVVLELQRTGGTDGAVSVRVNTQNGSAMSGSDYQAISSQLVTWADGDSRRQNVTLNLVNDDVVENDETMSVTIGSATGGVGIGVGTVNLTIEDDDTLVVDDAGQVSFTRTAMSVSEGQGSVVLQLRRTGGSDGAISVRVNTQNGSATSGSDYQAISNRLVTWADGDSGGRSVTLNLVNDSVVESDERLSVSIGSATGGASIGVSTVNVTIEDDDVAAPDPESPDDEDDILSLIIPVLAAIAAKRQ